MNFENKLISGELIKRYKRFFVDVKINNDIVTAHCPNTGSMMGLLKSGNKVWLASQMIQRKLNILYKLSRAVKLRLGSILILLIKLLDALQKGIIKEFKYSNNIQKLSLEKYKI